MILQVFDIMQTNLMDHGFKAIDRMGYPVLGLLNSKRSGLNMPKAKVKEVVNVPTGDYKGTIEKNEIITRGSGNDTYEYHVTHLKLDVTGNPVLEKGVPFSITENTLLGQMLQTFGANVKKAASEKKELDTDDYLKVGTKVTVSVVRKSIPAKTGGGSFEVSNVDHFVPVK